MHPGLIFTVAGSGRLGTSGDGGPATAADLNRPYGVAVDAHRRIYIAEYMGRSVRLVVEDGTIHQVISLRSPSAIACGVDGEVFVSDWEGGRVLVLAPDGTRRIVAGKGHAPSADGVRAKVSVRGPAGLACARDGAVFIADAHGAQLLRLDASGELVRVAGTGRRGTAGDGGPAVSAELYQPTGVAVTLDGEMYVADTAANRVRMVRRDGTIYTIAGTGERASGGDSGPATDAQLDSPFGVCCTRDGTIFIAEWGSHRIRRVTPDGIINTVAGTGAAGTGGDGGPAADAQLAYPRHVAIDNDGNLYIADSESNRIRVISHAAPSLRLP